MEGLLLTLWTGICSVSLLPFYNDGTVSTFASDDNWFFHFHYAKALAGPPQFGFKLWCRLTLRLLELVGSGRTSVRHSRNLGAIYDSDVVMPLGAGVGGTQFFFWSQTTRKNIHAHWFSKISVIQLSSGRESGLHERARRSGASLPVKMTFIEVPMKKSCDDPTIVMESWPILLPTDFVPCHSCGFLVGRNTKKETKCDDFPQSSSWCGWGICFAVRRVFAGLGGRCGQLARLLATLPGGLSRACGSFAGPTPEQECWLHSLLRLAKVPTSFFFLPVFCPYWRNPKSSLMKYISHPVEAMK